MSVLNPTAEALRSKHIKTLDALKGVLDENKALKQQMADLRARVDELLLQQGGDGGAAAAATAATQVMKIVELEAKLEKLGTLNAGLKAQVGRTKALEERVTQMAESAERKSVKTQQYIKELGELRAANVALEEKLRAGTGGAKTIAAEAEQWARDAEKERDATALQVTDLTVRLGAAEKAAELAGRHLATAEAAAAAAPSPEELEQARADVAALREANEVLTAEGLTYRRMAVAEREARAAAEARGKDLATQMEFGRQELQKLQELLERRAQELKRTAVALTTARSENEGLRQRATQLEEEAAAARRQLPEASPFARHVDGSRKLKEQNQKLQKQIAQLQKQLHRR